MAERDLRERDILVAPQEYGYVQDLTKGDIVLYVGPTKISLSNTERMVMFQKERFTPLRTDDSSGGVLPFVSASNAQYIILENPTKDANLKPVKGANYAVELINGRKVVVSGPAAFPLWPGQRARVIDGHALREDQYLVVRVYDKIEGEGQPIGTDRIVRGTEVSFYIPSTGLEVIPDANGSYVRSAVTLLDGEYCVLVAPNGKKKYCRGPAVVFPEPMEEFVLERARTPARVFKAWQLRRNMGLHVRIVKDFEALDGDQIPAGRYKAGQELFIKEQEGFFFPTEYLEIVGEVSAIPVGDKDGIYIRDLESGRISTIVGPCNFLRDPIRQEVVTRQLSAEQLKLYGVAGAGQAGKAVSVYIPPSFAVMVTAKDRREVVHGPRTRILDFDEDLEVLKLSTGRPKSEDQLLSTCFLITEGNKVSDIIKVKTADHVELEITVSYRVSFVTDDKAGESPASHGVAQERWFKVNNYVGLLCDHMASIVRAAVRSQPIDVFHTNPTETVRNAILGEKKEGKRPGRLFDENLLSVYDVELLELKILDGDVKKLLSDAQRSAITFEVTRKQERQRLEHERLKQEVNRQIYEAQMTTTRVAMELEEAEKALALTRTRLGLELDRVERVGKASHQAQANQLLAQAELEIQGRKLELTLQEQQGQVQAFERQMAALAPELISTLKVLGDQQLAGELTRNLSPLAILGGESVADVAGRLLKSLPISVKLSEQGPVQVEVKNRKGVERG